MRQATELLLAGNEREFATLDADSEAEAILADGPLDPAVLVEDELVLTLPFAPRHEGACPARRSQALRSTRGDIAQAVRSSGARADAG